MRISEISTSLPTTAMNRVLITVQFLPIGPSYSLPLLALLPLHSSGVEVRCSSPKSTLIATPSLLPMAMMTPDQIFLPPWP